MNDSNTADIPYGNNSIMSSGAAGPAEGGLEGIASQPRMPNGYVPMENERVVKILTGIKSLSAYNQAADSIVQAKKTNQLVDSNMLELKGVYKLGREISQNQDLYSMINEQVSFNGEDLNAMSPTDRIRKIGEVVASFLTLPEYIDIYQKAESRLARDVAYQTVNINTARGIAGAVGGEAGVSDYKKNTNIMQKLEPIDKAYHQAHNNRTFTSTYQKVEKPLVQGAAVVSAGIIVPLKVGMMGMSQGADALGQVYRSHPVSAWGFTVGEAIYGALLISNSPLLKVLGENPNPGEYVLGALGMGAIGALFTSAIYYTKKGADERKEKQSAEEIKTSSGIESRLNSRRRK